MPEDSAPSGEQFFVRDAIAIVFARMPAKLRRQFAYQHFYTDTIDPAAQCLSIKFFSLLILYYCTVFRLEGRRRQYTERQTGKSGQDFAKAHEKTRATFEAMACCYSSLVLRYNSHNVIEYTARGGNASAAGMDGGGAAGTSVDQRRALKSGPFSIGLKAPLAQVKRCHAFEFASDELVFFEMLYQASVQIVMIAFEGDANIQQLASEEVNKLFRSRSFLFHEQKRSVAVASSLRQLDSRAKSLLENNRQLAELLSDPAPHLSMRLASTQRTPFVACTFPGQHSTLKYQRVKRPNGEVVASVAERDYSLETKVSPFPAGHRAKAASASAAAFGGGGAGGSRTSSNTTGYARATSSNGRNSIGFDDDANAPTPTINVEDPQQPSESAQPGTTTIGRSKTSAVTVANVTGQPKATVLPSSTPTSSNGAAAPVSPLGADVASPGMDSTMSGGGAGGNGGSSSSPNSSTVNEVDQLVALLRQPLAQWASTDLYPEISSIYQALANGVVVTNFGLPTDLQLIYDDDGLLISVEDVR